MGENNYKPGDKVTRKQALNDLKHDVAQLVRLERVTHSFTGILVDLVRIIGVADRDDSQMIGRALAGLCVFGAVLGLGLLLTRCAG